MPEQDAPTDVDGFRAGLREWLAANVPAKGAPAFYTPERRAFDTAWQRRLWEAGYGALNWPAELGGRPVSTACLIAFHEEIAAADAPDQGCLFISLSHAGPTIASRGSDEQKSRYIPPILRGEHVWCQGFSEPEAGSDLAAIRTSGRVAGDRVVVNGRKIWTSYGPLADYCELLVRTDPDAGRHRGLTWIILDMRASGVQVRPIRTLTGNPRFSEVTLDDVEIPVQNVVGKIGDGWNVAMSTLGFERGSAMIGRQVRTQHRIDSLRQLIAQRAGIRDPAVSAELNGCARDALVMKALVRLSLDPDERCPQDGSMLRVFHSQLVARITRLAMEVLGPDVALGGHWTTEYLNELRSKVTAGTLDIQRNIIGERHLGLPR